MGLENSILNDTAVLLKSGKQRTKCRIFQLNQQNYMNKTVKLLLIKNDIKKYFVNLLLFLAICVGVEWFYVFRQKEYKKILKRAGVFLAAGILAVGCNITSLWNTADYVKVTIRGASELSSDKENKTSGLDKDYATQWSLVFLKRYSDDPWF